MRCYAAMEVIKDLVQPEYHVWLRPAQENNDERQLNIQSMLFTPEPRQSQQRDDLQENLKDLNIPSIEVAKLTEATDNWAERNILGKGGFGTVYQGYWLETAVAIKKLEYRESRSASSREHINQSLNELRHLNTCRHDNILPIYGYALTEDTCYVVYQLMLGRTLEERLFGKQRKPLTWPERWTIAKGTAK